MGSPAPDSELPPEALRFALLPPSPFRIPGIARSFPQLPYIRIHNPTYPFSRSSRYKAETRTVQFRCLFLPSLRQVTLKDFGLILQSPDPGAYLLDLLLHAVVTLVIG